MKDRRSRCHFRQAAIYVDRILRGAPATELPIHQPTKFELVINVTGARDCYLYAFWPLGRG
jgi:hypothetical protein